MKLFDLQFLVALLGLQLLVSSSPADYETNEAREVELQERGIVETIGKTILANIESAVDCAGCQVCFHSPDYSSRTLSDRSIGDSGSTERRSSSW